MSKTDKWTLEEVDSLTDYEEIRDISCPVTVSKEIGGVKHFFALKVSADGEQLLGETHSEPVPTQPTRGFHNGGATPWEWQTIFKTLKATLISLLFLMDEAAFDVLTCYIQSTYFREVFGSYGYLDFASAEVDCGKSTALMAVTWASHYGDLQVNPTPAGIYRTIAIEKGMLGVDELDNSLTDKETKGLLTSVFDCGYKRGLPVVRVDNVNGHFVPTRFDCFGPKAISRVGPIPRSIESRCITVNMHRAPASAKLEALESPEVFRQIRDQLYRRRIFDFGAVVSTYERLKTTIPLSNRAREIFLPVLTMASLVDEETFVRVLSFAKNYSDQRKARYDDEFVKTLVEVLLRPEYLGAEVPVINIANDLDGLLRERGLLSEDSKKLGSKWVISRLEGLDLKRGKKTHGFVHFVIRKDITERWARDVYGLLETGEQEGLGQILPDREPVPIPPATSPTSPTSPRGPGEESEVSEGKGGKDN
jgi:hypothetical protein